jgi:hypothetical protein
LPSAIGDAFISECQIDDVQDLYPLDTYLCLTCGHLQNLDVVDPEILFRNYTYCSSASLGLVEHFRKYADSVVTNLEIPTNSFVVEIGSNDGSLLKAYKALGMRVLGVDPAKLIATNATSNGIKTLPEFFTLSIAEKILSENGPANLLCANNVFAHADNIRDIAKGIRALLTFDGVFVFEVSYIVDMIDNFVFDTIYHEHVSHHAMIPLESFFNSLDLTLFDAVRVPTKGGSIRGFAQQLSSGKRPKTQRYLEMIEQEALRKVTKPDIYRAFYQDIEKRKNAVIEFLDREIQSGKIIAGYGASTTTTTLLYHFELQTRLQYIIDDNPLKQNMYSPGAHLPVYSSATLLGEMPDFVVILAWQYAETIINNSRAYLKNGGTIVVPLPVLRVYSSSI